VMKPSPATAPAEAGLPVTDMALESDGHHHDHDE